MGGTLEGSYSQMVWGRGGGVENLIEIGRGIRGMLQLKMRESVCLWDGGRQRETEIERRRQTGTERDRDRETETDRNRERQR